MRRPFVMPMVVAMTLMALGAAACGSSTKNTVVSAAAHKKAFCAANEKIDKASANVNSAAGFLTVLKDHKSAISAMDKNLPSGTLGTEARQEIAAAHAAIASGNANDINNVPSSAGGDLDTYCGVDGSGDPLPAYFATGKGGTFCSTFIPIYEAVGNATTPAATLATLEAHKTQIAQLATDVSGLPTSIKSKASAAVSNAQTAIAENSVTPLNGNGNGPAAAVALYCGQNQ